jgi:hypothetical protein
VLAHAIHLATTPPMGPVFVSLPMDDMQAELDDTQAADIAAVRDRKVLQAVGFPADLAEQICARIEAATSPALIVGGEILRRRPWVHLDTAQAPRENQGGGADLGEQRRRPQRALLVDECRALLAARFAKAGWWRATRTQITNPTHQRRRTMVG